MVKITFSIKRKFQADKQALNRDPAERMKPKIEHKWSVSKLQKLNINQIMETLWTNVHASFKTDSNYEEVGSFAT